MQRQRPNRGAGADAPFDWTRPARALQVPLAAARVLYEEALDLAAYPGAGPAEDAYQRLLEQVAPRARLAS